VEVTLIAAHRSVNLLARVEPPARRDETPPRQGAKIGRGVFVQQQNVSTPAFG